MTDRWYEPGEAPQTDWERFALEFVRALRQAEFDRGHSMLCPTLAKVFSPSALESKFDRLSADPEDRDGLPWILSSIEQWPEKAADTLGSAYVMIAPQAYQSMSVHVGTCQGRFEIVELWWGRP